MSPGAGHLRISDLRKVYGKGTVANDGISLDVRPGEVFGLLGPNGAGKTTLVNQIIGLLKPTSGSIHLGGIDLVASPSRARQLCSYLPQAEPPIDSFQLHEVVELVGRIRGGDKTAVRERTGALITGLELEEWEKSLGQKLSGGVKRLAGFMMAAVWPGSLMILDEPTNDIDPLRRRLLWREIRRIAGEGTTVLLVTHNVLEAERVVDRLAVIDKARIVAEGTPSSLKGADRGRLRLEIMLEPAAVPPERPSFAGQWTPSGRRLLLAIDESRMASAIEWAQGLAREGIAEEYAVTPPTLEDTYVRLVGRTDASEMTPEEDHVAVR